MGTIGERAAKAIQQQAMKGTSANRRTIKVKDELDRLDIPQENFYHWKKGESNPSAYYLQQMALAGYDVIWILTGKEKER